MVGLLDIRAFERIGNDRLEATIPSIIAQTAFGLLHGDLWCWRKVSARSQAICVRRGAKIGGAQVNANHVRSARQGRVRRRPVKRCIPGLAIEILKADKGYILMNRGRLYCCSLTLLRRLCDVVTIKV